MIFEKYVPLNTGQSLSSKRIRELVEDKKGNVWIGTEDGGVNILSRSGQITRMKSNDKEQRNRTILNMSIYGENIYCGLFKEGLDVIKPTGEVVHYSDKALNIEEGLGEATGRCFKLGMPVRIEVEDCDRFMRTINFRLVDQ